MGGIRGYQQADGSGPTWYVAKKDLPTNTLYVVPEHDHPYLLSRTLSAQQSSWIAGVAPACTASYGVKTRYRQVDTHANLKQADANEFVLDFEQSQWAVTPGQSAVVYDGEVCLGGGIIN